MYTHIRIAGDSCLSCNVAPHSFLALLSPVRIDCFHDFNFCPEGITRVVSLLGQDSGLFFLMCLVLVPSIDWMAW